MKKYSIICIMVLTIVMSACGNKKKNTVLDDSYEEKETYITNSIDEKNDMTLLYSDDSVNVTKINALDEDMYVSNQWKYISLKDAVQNQDAIVMVTVDDTYEIKIDTVCDGAGVTIYKTIMNATIDEIYKNNENDYLNKGDTINISIPVSSREKDEYTVDFQNGEKYMLLMSDINLLENDTLSQKQYVDYYIAMPPMFIFQIEGNDMLKLNEMQMGELNVAFDEILIDDFQKKIGIDMMK